MSTLYVQSIDGLLLKIYKYKPLRGSSFIELLRDIEDKHCVINVQNNDKICFKYSILAKHVIRSGSQLGSHYDDIEDKYDFFHLTYQVLLKDISLKFKRYNPLFSVNVFVFCKL